MNVLTGYLESIFVILWFAKLLVTENSIPVPQLWLGHKNIFSEIAFNNS